jgi:putative Holliday junction resolvase
MMQRVLGLDVGDKTIGVAVSDGLGITAQGVTTIRRQSFEKDFAALEKIIEEYEAVEIVIGLPKMMDGTEAVQSGKVREFAAKIEKRFSLPITFVDERLSTALVQKMMIEGGVRREKRREVVDMLAAQIILQSYIDRKKVRPGLD